jgi:predicted glycogen debranching enzyme
VPGGLRLQAFEGAVPLFLFSSEGVFEPKNEWQRDYFLAIEAYRGQGAEESHLLAAELRATLRPGEALTLVASTRPDADTDGDAALQRREAYDRALLRRASLSATSPPELQQLVLAADQFIVARIGAGDPDGHSIIAGYPWFGDWGRDTMISLPGLTLVTGRPEVARSILLTFARFVDQGMLPNRFPDEGEEPEYNTVDATLWYFEAIRAFMAATNDRSLLETLFPVLADIIDWHQRGARYNIHVDPADGLIAAGEAGVQLTWMDAIAGDWVVTPRMGKPVEINALWYNALRIMADFARQLGREVMAGDYEQMADQVRQSFQRFWNEDLGYCYDVLDGPDGDDPALRPNQLFAVSLPHSPLTPAQQKAVVDVCARRLLTPYGLRSLDPDHSDYHGHYGGDRLQRDAAYHQGTVWGWLIGPFVSAHLRVYGDPVQARSFLLPLLKHLNAHGAGSMSEIFDGDPPFTPRGCPAQAWTVAEVLRVWAIIDNLT